MLKRSLIVFSLAATLCASPLQADTPGYVEIFPIPGQEVIRIFQMAVDPFTFAGGTNLQILNSFPGVRLGADVTSLVPDGAWFVSLVENGNAECFEPCEASLLVPDVHWPEDNPGLLKLSVKIEGFNPVVVPYDPQETQVVIARVCLTIMPQDPEYQGEPVPVAYIDVVFHPIMWAEMLCLPGQEKIILEESPSVYALEGGIKFQLLNNFPYLQVNARICPILPANIRDISLVENDNPEHFMPDMTSFLVTNVHMPQDNPYLLNLSVRFEDIDFQSLSSPPEDEVLIAKILLTMRPVELPGFVDLPDLWYYDLYSPWVEKQLGEIDVVFRPASAEGVLEKLIGIIQSLPANSLKNKNSSQALVNKIEAVLSMIRQELYAEALDKLQHDLAAKADGCANQGAPDKNDWIVTCEAQNSVYPLLTKAITLLERLLQ